MALKDVLEDKKKKRTITIVGTIVIILVTAGVFSYEASSIEVKEPPKEEVTTGETTTSVTPTGNETLAHEGEEGDDTITGTPGPLIKFYMEYSFQVKENARSGTVKIEWSTGKGDLDLYVYDPQGNEVGSSANSGFQGEEVVELSAGDLRQTGEWTFRVIHWAGTPVEYHWSWDTYY